MQQRDIELANPFDLDDGGCGEGVLLKLTFDISNQTTH